MSDEQTPTVLTDAQLLAWAVTLEHRQQSQEHGINFLLLPLPPCPTCGEPVHEARATWTWELMGKGGCRLDALPCAHSHTASELAIERVYGHVRQMLDGIEDDGRQGRGPHAGDIIKEAEARVGKPDLAVDVECAIGLNTGGGGADGVYAARDAVLAVRDQEVERLRARLDRVQAIADRLAAQGRLGVDLEADSIRRGIAQQLHDALGTQAG
ncbi:hypothetical protein [Streptomyces microflavus]|uniref:hypothetical protein n=1 Tax=Streptomyces microflavus TaxID=1919 RepID=UPI00324EE177